MITEEEGRVGVTHREEKGIYLKSKLQSVEWATEQSQVQRMRFQTLAITADEVLEVGETRATTLVIGPDPRV